MPNPRGRPRKLKQIIENECREQEAPTLGLSFEKPNADAPVPNWAPVKTSPVFDTYWRFAAERQKIFFARVREDRAPWTDDRILLEHKFTNAYRASDRVSQYLIRNVIYSGDQSPNEVFFRTILFKFFNRIETWELLTSSFGQPRFSDFDLDRYAAVLDEAMNAGERIYSAAYIMPSGGKAAGPGRKHHMHLRLLQRMLSEELPDRLTDCRNMRLAFELLRAYPTIGDFLAYQYVTDLNYGPLLNFSEMQFVCPGPGAKDGIRKCFSDTAGLSEPELIKLMAERQDDEFLRLGIKFSDLWGRKLQLIDCQNLFCEVDKYARVAHPEISGHTGRTRIKQKFRPTMEPIRLWYPPKWGINDKLPSARLHVH